MKNITVKNILEVTNGKLINGKLDEKCINFLNDSRKVKEGDTYIALKGEKFDGNKFWREAIEKGANCVIIEKEEISKEEKEKYKEKAIIQVEDTLEALYKIATSSKV